MEATGAAGTICVYGCPAEEIMSGKIVMNDQGVFDDLDVAITWHPFDRNRVSNDIWQAQDIKNYTFHGLSSHAAKAPEKGRSALDAAELMNVGAVSYTHLDVYKRQDDTQDHTSDAGSPDQHSQNSSHNLCSKHFIKCRLPHSQSRKYTVISHPFSEI